MRVCFVGALALLIAGCTTFSEDLAEVTVDEDVRMSVRLVATSSDVAVVRPDYQIVIAGSSRVVQVPRAVVWDAAAPAGLYGQRPMPAAMHADQVAQPQPPQALPVSREVKRAVDKSVFLSEAHFEVGSAQLTSKAKALLDEAAVDIQQMDPKKLSILGHADSVGGEGANQRLSERRAEAVFEYLRKKGVRIQNVERVGFGERAPASSNSSDQGRAMNRRAEVMATVAK